jgi:hypothetical protein
MMDLDGVRFDIECPQCKFSTQIFYRDARLRDVLICVAARGISNSMTKSRGRRGYSVFVPARPVAGETLILEVGQRWYIFQLV